MSKLQFLQSERMRDALALRVSRAHVSSASACRRICCFRFFLEKSKGAQIFPAVFWLRAGGYGCGNLRPFRYFWTAGKGLRGLTCLRRLKGMIPLRIPASLARSWIRRAEVRCYGESWCLAGEGVTGVDVSPTAIPLRIPASLARSWIRRAEVRCYGELWCLAGEG